MNSSNFKEISLLQLNNEDLKIKKKRRTSYFNIQNTFKPNFFFQSPAILNKSISRLSLKKENKNNSIIPEKNNIIKDYLQSHKFQLQRKNSKKTTIKVFKSKINNSFISNNNNNSNVNECASMIYFPKQKNTKKLNEDIIDIEKENNPNLKQVENLLMNKLFNMKVNLKNTSNIEPKKLKKSINKTKSVRIIKEKRRNSNFFLNVNFKRGNSNNHLPQRSSIFNSNLTSNHRSSIFSQSINNKANNRNSLNRNSLNRNSLNRNSLNLNSQNFNPVNLNKSSNEMKRISFEKINDIGNDKLKLTDYTFKKFRRIKRSTKSLSSKYILLEKSRNLYRTNNLYDSLDDDESDKDEESYDNCLLPNSYYILINDLLLFLSTIYCAFYIPLRMAKADCFCNKESRTNKAILYLIDIYYIFEICLNFFRAYYNYKLKLIKSHHKIIIHYLKSDFLFDLIEAVPIFSYSNLLCVNNKEANICFPYSMSNSFIILKILTNIKIIKIFKIRNKQKNITFNTLLNLFSENYSLENFLDSLIDFLHFFLAFHFFICLNIFLAKQTYPNWLITINSQDNNFLYNYIISSYSLTETLTTVGYGDVVCQSTFERIFQIFFLGVGVIAYSYIISSFGNLIKNERLSSIKYDNNMKILEEIRVEYPNMPYKLYNKIYTYIESRNVADIKMDANILTNSLPFNLRNVLLLIMYNSCIKNFKFFKKVQNSNFIIEVLSKFVPATSKKSDILVYEGEMIEEIIIVKDGRLSLEVAIDMEDPESSIEKYFNVNFQGITTAKEMKKIEEAKKLNISQLIQSKKTKDFDNAKNVLNNAVKKQVNYLLNEACDDASILDKTKDNKREEKKLNKTKSDYLKNEPIKNEKGNFKYIKVIDIRKNENFGGLYMFMRRPSPLSLKVKSKFAELYLIPKKDIFDIAKNYNNIWSKIHKKDFHNMLSIKHQTFNILNKYIEFNGIENLNLNDITNCDFVFEDKKRNISFHNNYRLSDKSLLNSPSPIIINRNTNSHFIPMFNNNIQNKNYIYNNQRQNNFLSNKSLKNIMEQENTSQQQAPGDLHFSQLLTLMANGKQNINNSNINNSSLNNSDNLNNKNTNNNINSNINNNYLSNKNVNEIKNSSRSLPSNSVNEIQKTNQTNEEGKTLIIQKSSEILLPTLNFVFNDNKVENIKVKMKKSKQKEKRRKIFSLGKKTAKLFNNKNYSIILLDKDNDEFIELENNNNSDIIKKKIDNNVINKISSNLTLNQNKILLDNIPEISADDDDEFSIHQFDNTDLSKEGVIAFTLNAIYKNINIHTNLKYSQNKVYQEKTLNYLTKLMNNKTRISSSLSNSKISKSSSFSISFTSKIRPVSFNSIDKSIQNSSFNNKMFSSKKFDDLLKLSENECQANDYRSEGLYETKKRKFNNKNKNMNNNRLKVGSSNFSRVLTEFNNKKSAITNKSNNHLDLIKNKPSKKSKKSIRKSKKDNNFQFTLKIDSANDNFSNNSVNSKKKNRKKLGLFEDKKKFKKNSAFLNSENIINLKTFKNSKTFKISDIKKSQLSENKSTIKNKLTKRKSNKVRNEFKLDNIGKDKNEEVNKSFDYLAKEERNENECKII